jgi:hypothetical protein
LSWRGSCFLARSATRRFEPEILQSPTELVVPRDLCEICIEAESLEHAGIYAQ